MIEKEVVLTYFLLPLVVLPILSGLIYQILSIPLGWILLPGAGLVTYWYQTSVTRPKKIINGDNYNVIVVGGGMSGLCAGAKLAQAGVPFTIFESGHYSQSVTKLNSSQLTNSFSIKDLNNIFLQTLQVTRLVVPGTITRTQVVPVTSGPHSTSSPSSPTQTGPGSWPRRQKLNNTWRHLPENTTYIRIFSSIPP